MSSGRRVETEVKTCMKEYWVKKKNGGCDVHQAKSPAHGKIQANSWGALP